MGFTGGGGYFGTVQSGAPSGGVPGSFVSVANEAALTALDATGFREGSLAYVETWRDYAEMRTQALALIPHVILASTPRPAVQWNRTQIPHPSWSTVATYFIDPAGNDENVGQAAGAANALQTIQEFQRRIRYPSQSMTVNLAAGVYGVPLAIAFPGAERNTAGFPTITFTGTRTTRVGPFVLDASADVAGNALATFTSAAGAAALLVGDIVESVDTLATAVIVAAPGGGVFTTSRWRSAAGAVVAPPAALASIRALTLSQFTRRSISGPLNVIINDCQFTTIDSRPVGSFMIMSTCIIPGFTAGFGANEISRGCSVNNTGTHGCLDPGTQSRNQSNGIFGGGTCSYAFLGRGEFTLGTAIAGCRVDVGVAGSSGLLLINDAGLINSPSHGIRVEKNGMISIEGAMYGSNHATIGARVQNDGHVYVLPGVTPTMASLGQELQIDNRATGAPITWASWNTDYLRNFTEISRGSSVIEREA